MTTSSNIREPTIFSAIGEKTKLCARFITVAGKRRADDAERDIRGFPLESYIERVSAFWSVT